jgi:hypothetical protein
MHWKDVYGGLEFISDYVYASEARSEARLEAV